MSLTTEERRARTMAMPKCSVVSCNQRAAMDTDVCGTHRQERASEEARQADRDDLRAQIEAAETVDDLKDVLREMLERIGC